MKCATSLTLTFMLVCGASSLETQYQAGMNTQPGTFSESIQQMHSSMAAVTPSGNDDTDFARLMIPHHQAAIDMARIQLLRGKDPELRRLAQQIITDQQLELDVMRLWLEQHGPRSRKEH